MKKSIRRILIVISTALCMAAMSLGIFAACGSKAKLTLDAGKGGTLSKTEYSVKKGTDLWQYLQDKTPAVSTAGLSFAGWYNGNTPITSGTTMPKEGLSLTAKYNADYNIEVYTYNEETETFGAAVKSTGKGLWKEPLNIVDVYPFDVGYAVDLSQPDSVTTTPSLEIGFTFKIYQKVDYRTVSFRLNAPESDNAFSGSIPSISVGRGRTFTAPDGNTVYTSSLGYRFIGWSENSNDEVPQYRAGEGVVAKGDMTLYAVWEKGKTDIFGGNDYLFVNVKPGYVYLHRAGFAEQEGTYDANTSIFIFKRLNGTNVLEGKISGDQFYYFRDLKDKTFTYGGEPLKNVEKEELTFGALDAVTYTVTPSGKTGTAVNGSFAVDPATGDYVFIKGGDESFYFSLFVDRTLPEGEQNRFVRTSDDEEVVAQSERGFYALWDDNEKGYDETQAFQLDGMYDSLGFASAGIYLLENGKYERAITTYYGLESKVIHDEEDEGAMMLATAAAKEEDDFVIIFHDTDGEEVYPHFRVYKSEQPFEANGRTFDGVFRLEDGFRGDFGTADEFYNGTGEPNAGGEIEAVTSLHLDGFGGAVYTERGTDGAKDRLIKGTYTIKTLSAHGASFEYLYLTLSTNKSMFVQIVGGGYGVTYYTTSDKAPSIVEIDGSPLKVYEQFTGTETGVSVYDKGYFYIYEGSSVNIYTYFTDIFDNVTEVSVGADFGLIQEKEGEDGVYTFVSYLLGSGLPLFDFRYTKEGKIEMSLPFTEEAITGAAAETIKVDKWGTLTYGGKDYAYGSYTVNVIEKSTGVGTGSWYIREYTFRESGKTADTVVRVRGDYHETETDSEYRYETLVGDDRIMELIKKRFPDQNSYFDHIYLNGSLPTTDEGETKVDIILTVSADMENFYDIALLTGTITYDTQSKLYKMTLDEPHAAANLQNLLMETYTLYGGESGCYLMFGEGSAVVIDSEAISEYSVEKTQTADGSALSIGFDGTATYTDKDGKTFTGEFAVLASIDEDTSSTKVTHTLLRITAASGDVKLLLFTKEETADAQSAGSVSTYTITEISSSSEAGNYTYMAGSAGYYNLFFGASITLFGEISYGGEDVGIYYMDLTYVTDNQDDIDMGTYVSTGRTLQMESQTFTEYLLTSFEKYNEDEDGQPDRSSPVTRYIAVASVPYGNNSGSEGGTTKVFLERIYDVEHFVIEEGGFIESNGYELPTYQDEMGVTWLGLYGRENIDDSSAKVSDYIPTGDHLTDGKQLIFMAQYLTDDEFIYELDEDLHFLFDVVERDDVISLTLRDDLTGTLALFERSELHLDTLLYFDGHGGVTLKRTGKKDIEGAFTYDEKTQHGHFTSDEGEEFDFTTFTIGLDGEQWNIFVKSSEEYLYLNDDWSLLSLKYYGAYPVNGGLYNGVYSDRWGASYYGFYEFLTDDLVLFSTDERDYFFNLTGETEFELNNEEFVISENILYGYQGPSFVEDLKIPDGVKEIAHNVFAYMYIQNSLDLNQVEKIGYRAFYEANIGEHDLHSDYVTEIGDEAFYTSGTYDFRTFQTNFSWIENVNMPALKKIGARAFYYSNQMRSGTITLRDIEEIGAQAFMHIVNPESGTMVLDLRGVKDLAKVTIHDTAFDDILGKDSPYNLGNLPPVRILINESQRSQTAQWPEKIKAWISTGNSSNSAPVGQSIMNFGPAVTKDICNGGSWTEDGDERRYFE